MLWRALVPCSLLRLTHSFFCFAVGAQVGSSVSSVASWDDDQPLAPRDAAVLKAVHVLAIDPEADAAFPELILQDRDLLAALQRCPTEDARLAFLGDCLRFGFGGGHLAASPPEDVARSLAARAAALVVAAVGKAGAAEGAGGSGSGGGENAAAAFPDAATLLELEGRRLRRARVREARLGLRNGKGGAVAKETGGGEGGDEGGSGGGGNDGALRTSRRKRTVGELRAAKKREVFKGGALVVQAAHRLAAAAPAADAGSGLAAELSAPFQEPHEPADAQHPGEFINPPASWKA